MKEWLERGVLMQEISFLDKERYHLKAKITWMIHNGDQGVEEGEEGILYAGQPAASIDIIPWLADISITKYWASKISLKVLQ